MRKIKLSQGKVALVDDCDFDWLSQYNWRACKDRNTYYARRNVRLDSGKRTTEQMHRAVLGCTRGDGTIIDHKDGDGLNNTRGNIHLVTYSQNNCNRHVDPRGNSGFRGVTAHNGRWQAKIGIDGRTVYLGTFDTKEEAAAAFDAVAGPLGRQTNSSSWRV